MTVSYILAFLALLHGAVAIKRRLVAVDGLIGRMRPPGFQGAAA